MRFALHVMTGTTTLRLKVILRLQDEVTAIVYGFLRVYAVFSSCSRATLKGILRKEIPPPPNFMFKLLFKIMYFWPFRGWC